MNKRPALPYPAQALRDRQYLDASPRDTKTKLHDRLRQEYHDLQYRMDLLEARLGAVSTWQLEQSASPTKPAPTPSLPALNSIQPLVGRLCWSNNLASKYNNLGDSAGNISGLAWCNGLFLSDGYFLTAGHCFDTGGGWQRPNHYGIVSSPEIIAPLFNVCGGNDSATDNRLQVKELTYHRPSGLDCSIVRLSQQDGSVPAADNDTGLDLTRHNGVERDGELFDTDVFLVDYQPCPPTEGTGTAPTSFHKVQITQHQHSLINFTCLTGDNTLSGTPLITRDGNIVGIKISSTEAVDIRAIAKILEADKPAKQKHAHA